MSEILFETQCIANTHTGLKRIECINIVFSGVKSLCAAQVDSAPVTRLTMIWVDLQPALQGHTTERHHTLLRQDGRHHQYGPAVDQPDPTIGISSNFFVCW